MPLASEKYYITHTNCLKALKLLLIDLKYLFTFANWFANVKEQCKQSNAKCYATYLQAIPECTTSNMNTLLILKQHFERNLDYEYKENGTIN